MKIWFRMIFLKNSYNNYENMIIYNSASNVIKGNSIIRKMLEKTLMW